MNHSKNVEVAFKFSCIRVYTYVDDVEFFPGGLVYYLIDYHGEMRKIMKLFPGLCRQGAVLLAFHRSKKKKMMVVESQISWHAFPLYSPSFLGSQKIKWISKVK